jgi:hypothetical protein
MSAVLENIGRDPIELRAQVSAQSKNSLIEIAIHGPAGDETKTTQRLSF